MSYMAKRILHFLPTLEVSSGSTAVVMNYYRNINRDNIQFDFLYFEESETSYISEIQRLGGRVYKIHRPGFSRYSIIELSEFFKQHYGEWTAFHCHPVYAAVTMGWIAKKYGIRHIIQHSHSSQFGNTKKSSIRNYIISRLNFLTVTDYFACSREAEKLLGWKFVYKDKVHILNNAIDCERFRFSHERRKKIREEYGISENMVVFGHSGRFSPEKNHNYLIEVFSAYYKQNSNSKLMLLGDGEGRDSIAANAKKHNIEEQIIFLGRRDNPEDFLCAMDFFVFPSFYEGLSLALVEAQCSGLCCYVSENVDHKTRQIDTYFEFSLSEAPAQIAAVIPKEIPKSNRFQCYDKLKESELNLAKEANKLETYYMQF